MPRRKTLTGRKERKKDREGKLKHLRNEKKRRLAPTNDACLMVNSDIINRMTGEEKTYNSYDKIICDNENEMNNYPVEFLNSKNPSKYVRERMLLKHKPRKILNLEDRVQAIRMYDRTPVYQRVASVFQCSWEQIKNVVCNRNAILQYYARCQTVNNNDNAGLVRHKKINFLGNVMFEYIKRAHHYGRVTLSDEVIRQRSLEFRDRIKIDKFYPNSAWINDFKHVYNIDFARLETIVISEQPEESLNCADIIEYCYKGIKNASSPASAAAAAAATTLRTKKTATAAAMLKSMKQQQYRLQRHDSFAFDEKSLENFDVFNAAAAEDNDHEMDDLEEGGGEQDEDANDDDDGDYDEMINDDFMEETAMNYNESDEEDILPTTFNSVICDPQTVIKVEPDSNSEPEPEHSIEAAATKATRDKTIASYAEALKLLRPLEDFALVQEDFQALNLVTQLAAFYDKAIKKRDQRFSE